MSERKRGFPNLATRVPDDPAGQRGVFDKVDETVRAELVEAGVLAASGKGDPGNYMEDDWIRKSGDRYKEVPSAIFAAKHGWKFERRWYYYAAEGDGIPPDAAEEFHKTWGREVRVEGHCGCPSPLEWCHGFAVGSYHIDTQEGLNAFVRLLASIDRRANSDTQPEGKQR